MTRQDPPKPIDNDATLAAYDLIRGYADPELALKELKDHNVPQGVQMRALSALGIKVLFNIDPEDDTPQDLGAALAICRKAETFGPDPK